MEKTLTLPDTIINYEFDGQGPPLLMVHGVSADRTSLSPLRPFLEDHFTVYAMDRRGRNKSIDQGDYAVHKEFDDIASLVDAIYQDSGNQPVNLMGHSFGGFCCLEAILLTPHIKSLILYEPAAPGIKDNPPQEVVDHLQKLLDAGKPEEVLTLLLKNIAGMTDDEIAALREGPGWDSRVAAAHTISREGNGLRNFPRFDPERFRHVDLPVLLVLGDESPSEEKAYLDLVHKALKNSSLVTLPNQAHLATRRAPDLLAREMVTFIEGLR